MAPQFVFEMKDVGKAYDEKVVLSNINLSFYYGAKIGVVGENGSGKSTLLRIMAGIDKDIDGTASLAKGMRVRYVAQEPELELDKTVRENLRTAVKPIQDLVDRFNDVSTRMADPQPDDDFDKLMEEMAQLQEKIDATGGWEVDRLMDIASDALVLPPDDAPIRQLSGGERRRVALCMALLEKPDLLLLDEPTNHLDAETVQWLEQALREYPGTVIIVTHDRYFLDNITRWILELENTRGLPFEGNYSSWLAQKSELLRVMEKKESQRQKTLQRELDWIRKSHEGRKQKNEARIKAYEQLASQETDSKSDAIIQIAPGPRLGEKVLTLRQVDKGFTIGGQPVKLIDGCTMNVPRGAVVGVIGPNGTGKTTLMRMIVGQEKPDAGTLELGPSVVLSYVDQHRDALDDEKTIFEEITDGQDTVKLGTVTMNSRLYVSRFNFRGPAAAEKSRRVLRRRAESHPPGQDAPSRRQPAASGRADERSGREHAACSGAGADRVPRLCVGDQPRPLLFGPHRHAPPGDGGQRQDAVVRGKLRGLRGDRDGRGPRASGPPPQQVQAARPAVMRPRPVWSAVIHRRFSVAGCHWRASVLLWPVFAALDGPTTFRAPAVPPVATSLATCGSKLDSGRHGQARGTGAPKAVIASPHSTTSGSPQTPFTCVPNHLAKVAERPPAMRTLVQCTSALLGQFPSVKVAFMVGRNRHGRGEFAMTRVGRRLVLCWSLALAGAALQPLCAATAQQNLVEEDWRKQDGIGTPRAPSTYQAAVEKTLDRGDRLIADLRSAGVSLRQETARWDDLRRESRKLASAAVKDGPAWEDLWRRVHRLRREIVLANPLAQTGPIVFVKQVPSMFSHQLTQYYGSCARPGGGVFVLDAPGRSLECRELTAGKLPLGSCQHLDVSSDGRRLLFAYCHAETAPTNRESHLDRFYHLYEMAADGSGLRQLTDGAYDDFAPRWLPNGKILFISTRRGGFHRCGRGPCPVYTLALANSDGSDPHPISCHETHEWDPVVLGDGRVLYTRWDYVDRNAVFYQQLWSVRPDGSDVRIFFGNNTYNPVGIWESRPVPGSNRVMATAAAHHAMTAGSIVLLDVTRGVDGLDPIARLTPDAMFPESEVPVSNGVGGAWFSPITFTKLPELPPEAVRWPGHCYRTPYPLSEKYFLAAYSFDPLLGEPVANRANMFGLYLVDSFGNKELLHRDPEVSSLWPAPLRARPCPPALPSLLEPTERKEGTFPAAQRSRGLATDWRGNGQAAADRAGAPEDDLARQRPDARRGQRLAGQTGAGDRAGRAGWLGLFPRPGRGAAGVPGPGRVGAGDPGDAKRHVPAAGREHVVRGLSRIAPGRSAARRGSPGPGPRTFLDRARPRRIPSALLPDSRPTGARPALRRLPQRKEDRRRPEPHRPGPRALHGLVQCPGVARVVFGLGRAARAISARSIASRSPSPVSSAPAAAP